ncbi:regulatory protein TetR [Bacillus methanolicus PB1]|uniref:Regulatory protein TetR n=1 Tax=Bacillus methanolicus PB1 TaxID=997296 RepID=I3E157_BACMT|nr:TetR/AcrR family transcriptional regulator [Bacillus methanolicus]EIJ80228.1 regulatory protein TetR [Bacillus methanolicus PB1]
MRGFTEQERDYIRQQLLEKGKELFSVHGLKKTSIKDLTESVGIAQGSFYLFFQSKEELYFRILEKEEEQMKESLLHHLSKPETPEDFASFLLKGIDLIQGNSFIQRLYFEGDMELLVRKLPAETIASHIQKDNNLLMPLLYSWGFSGFDEQTISGAIRAFFLMTLHRKEIGENHYEKTIRFLAEAISNQIFKGVNSND